MSKVVYLMGAGASYGKRSDGKRIVEGIPVVEEIKEEINRVIEWISTCKVPNEGYIYQLGDKNYNFDSIMDMLKQDFEWLRDGAFHHATIDTFAKKLLIRGDENEYRKLKFLLCTFFLIEQVIYPYDKRYDTFFANILTLNASIPDDIYIMTWNYDGQLGIAYREYVEENSCRILPEEKVFRINGSANFTGVNNIEACTLPSMAKEELLSRILRQYELAYNRVFSTGCIQLKFAWDEEGYNSRRKILYPNIQDAKVLVVIGYSFPFFNREIDRDIFMNMPNLEKIYIQDPKAEEIKEFLSSVLTENQREQLFPNVVILDKNKDNFYLPPEL